MVSCYSSSCGMTWDELQSKMYFCQSKLDEFTALDSLPILLKGSLSV